MAQRGQQFPSLAKIILAITLIVGSMISCTAQSIRNIPIHFHVHPMAQVETSQLDAQIAEINRVYAANGVPFRFQRQSVDNSPEDIGGYGELNVKIISQLPDIGVYVYPEDEIYLDDDALPNLISGTSGVVLVHEIGHWFGLMHETTREVKQPNCENQPPLISMDAKTCRLTADQIDEMIKVYDLRREAQSLPR